MMLSYMRPKCSFVRKSNTAECACRNIAVYTLEVQQFVLYSKLLRREAQRRSVAAWISATKCCGTV